MDFMQESPTPIVIHLNQGLTTQARSWGAMLMLFFRRNNGQPPESLYEKVSFTIHIYGKRHIYGYEYHYVLSMALKEIIEAVQKIDTTPEFAGVPISNEAYNRVYDLTELFKTRTADKR